MYAENIKYMYNLNNHKKSICVIANPIKKKMIHWYIPERVVKGLIGRME